MRDRMSKSGDEETKRDKADGGWMKDGDGDVGGGIRKKERVRADSALRQYHSRLA